MNDILQVSFPLEYVIFGRKLSVSVDTVSTLYALLEIRVIQWFFTNTTNPYPKGFSRCEKNLNVFLRPFTP
jgi:hypothetical protein